MTHRPPKTRFSEGGGRHQPGRLQPPQAPPVPVTSHRPTPPGAGLWALPLSLDPGPWPCPPQPRGVTGLDLGPRVPITSSWMEPVPPAGTHAPSAPAPVSSWPCLCQASAQQPGRPWQRLRAARGAPAACGPRSVEALLASRPAGPGENAGRPFPPAGPLLSIY